MKKGLLAAAVAAIALGGYFGGVSYTAGQANQALKDGVTQLQQTYGRNAADLVPQNESFASNTYVLNLDLAAFNPEITRPLLMPLNLSSEHGFLNSTTEATLAASDLRTRLLQLVQEAGEEPFALEVHSSYNPMKQGVDAEAELDIAHFAHTKERTGESFDFAGGEVEMSVSGKEFELELEFKPFTLETRNGTLELSGVKLEEEGRFATTDIFNAVMAEQLDAKLEFEQLKVSGRDEVELNDFELKLDQNTRDGRTLTNMHNTLDSAVFGNPESDQTRTLEDLSLALHFDFDQAALLKFVEQMSELEQPPRNPYMLVGMMSPLTEKGMRLGVTELKMTSQNQTLKGHLNLDVEAFELMQAMRNPMLVRDKLSAEGAFSVPKAIVDKMPRGERRQFQQLSQMGMIKETENAYEAQIDIKQGQASLNGQPLPM